MALTASSKPTEKLFQALVTEMNFSNICCVGGAGLAGSAKRVRGTRAKRWAEIQDVSIQFTRYLIYLQSIGS